MKVAGQTLCFFVLLTITMVMRTVGTERVSETVGNSCVLLCPPKPNTTIVAWKISLSAGTNCSFSYRADWKTSKSNCSDNISWKSRPHLDPTIEIQQVGLADEGNYTCEVATADGNFYTRYHLTVLVPPRLLLHCDDRGNPVCEAVAGKPAAQISWVPESNSTKEEIHGKGTVTVLSKVRACSSHLTNVTCVVLHPAGNQSKTIACCLLGNNSWTLLVSIIPCFLSIVTVTAVTYYCKFRCDRLRHKAKPPETPSTFSPEDDTMEVEPYTTYVQKENVIYNSVSDLTAGQNLPQILSPAT